MPATLDKRSAPRRLAAWAVRVATETGGHIEPIPIELERNPAALVELGAQNPPGVPLYHLLVRLPSGPSDSSQSRIPVYRTDNASPHPILKEIYVCEVAGKRLEAANIFALRFKVQEAIQVVAPGGSIPVCYFKAPRFDFTLAAFREGRGVVCPVLAGPKIRAADLAHLREPVVRYLRSAGYLDAAEEPELLVVRPSDLGLSPPAAIVRSLEDRAMWLPAVAGASRDGGVVGLIAHPAALRTSERRRRAGSGSDAPPSGPDVTALLRYVGHELDRVGRLTDPWSVYACDVLPEVWARTEELTDSTDLRLVCRLDEGPDMPLELPVRHTAAGEAVTALQEQAVTVFLAADPDTIAAHVGRYLAESGFLPRADDLRVEQAPGARSERLDIDAIWTGQSAGESTTTDQEVATP